MSQLPRHSRLASQGVGLCLAAALLVPAAPARAAQAGGQPSWVPIGPEGGEIAVLAAAPGGIVYAGAASGAGVLRSDDGGRHWRPPGNGLPTLFFVTALAVVPGRPEIVYVGGNQAGPYLSTDGGASWLPAGDGFPASNALPIVAAMAATAEGSAVYALDSSGRLCKATPGKRSWTRIALPALAGSITADPHRPSTLYIGTITGIYRTRDGGETWSLLGGGILPANLPAFNSPLVAIDPAAPGSLYALYRMFFGSSLRLVLFHSVDDGLSWAFHRVPLPSGSFTHALAVAPGGRVLLATPYTATAAPPLLESADGGATWTAAPGEPSGVIQAIVAAPGERATVYAGGGHGFWRSTDGGDRWRPSNDGLFAQTLISVRIGSDGSSSFLYAGVLTFFFEPEELFLFRRETGGTFRAVGGASYAVVGVDPVRPEVLYGSLFNESFFRLWKSYDGGLTWSALGFPEGELIDVFKIDPGSPRILYAGSLQTDPTDSSCHLSKSIDGGKTWACLLTLPDTSVLLIDPAHTSNLYLVSSSGQLYASRDGGAAWNPAARGLPPDQAVSILALDPSDSRRLFAGVQVSDQTADVYVSNDGARSWTRLARGLTGPISSLKVDPRQPLTLYAGVFTTGVFRSTDGGLHWHRFDAGLPPGSFLGGFLFDPVQPSIIYTVTYGAGVYMLDTGQP